MPSPHTITASNFAATSSLPSLSAAAATGGSNDFSRPYGGPDVAARNPRRLSIDRSHVAFAATAAGSNAAAPASGFNPNAYSRPARLPRTSSLLPPPHTVPVLSTAPLDASRSSVFRDYQPAFAAASSANANYNTRRPPTADSKSSSVSSANDGGIKNVNRWSASTSSSKASVVNQTPPRTAFARRQSIGAGVYPADLPVPAVSPGPRKLQKSRRPSAASEGQRPALDFEPEPPVPSFILTDLPPIVSLPALDLEVNDTSFFLSDRLSDSESRPRRLSLAGPLGQSADRFGALERPRLVTEKTSSSMPVTASATMASTRSAMAYERNMDSYRPKGHTRTRSQTKNSGDTTSSKSKDKAVRPPSQKAMLSKALQKANIAVQLDNAGNLDGAREAYTEACELLQQVLNRTQGDDDKRKLEAIRRTYTSRIEELDQMLPPRPIAIKALPMRPEINRLPPSTTVQDEDEDTEDYGVIETATVTRIAANRSPIPATVVQPAENGPRPSPRLETSQFALSPNLSSRPLQSAFSTSPGRSDSFIFRDGPEQQYMPPPLSPRRPPSPTKPVATKSPNIGMENTYNSKPAVLNGVDHVRAQAQDSFLLDPIDESGGSVASSLHSRSSSIAYKQGHTRGASGGTEEEFDAALDAAVEAAYDDGYEPAEPDELVSYEDGDRVVANALRKVELAKERVRQTARETLELEQERERRHKVEDLERNSQPTDFYEGDSSEEEERIFEEMSNGYSIDDFSLRARSSKPGLGRESDSSGFTTRTWQSSMGSNPNTATTMSTLTTVTEGPAVYTLSKPPNGMPPPPPPGHALPELPPQVSQTKGRKPSEGVRSRRLSGQTPKQLKIETAGLTQGRQPASARPGGGRLSPSQARKPSPAGQLPPSPPIDFVVDGEDEDSLRDTNSPTAFMPMLRTTYSETSLRSYRSRNMSTSNLDDVSEPSPRLNSEAFSIPNLPTPLAASFRDKMSGDPSGGLFLFDDNIHSPYSPGSPNPMMSGAPVALEPCPTDFLLRPFWLMRCLFQTLAHPRGGYLSNKLFVPRDAWKVKGVKLRNVEDKIASCDLLTAALLKFSQVNTYDADAVLDEMSTFERVLDQVQAALVKKLGAEVGNQGASVLFKDSPTPQSAGAGADDEPMSAVPRSGSVSGKASGGSSFSWRRLRSKNSSVGLGNAYGTSSGGGAGGSGGEVVKDVPIPASLPMTSHPTSRPTKRELGSVQFTGPQAAYMESLARLFDAAQALDEIARQVEDPGLKHANTTQFGLEFSARRVSEFFSFYILRFVLADLTLLLDKFVKKGSEWVVL